VTRTAGHGLVAVPLLLAIAVLILGALVAQALVTRRTLRARVRVRLLPADTFDPHDEAVIRFAAGLARSRRAVRGVLDRRASAVRILLDADADGRLGYAIELPGHARAALRTALGAYPHVEAHDEPMPDDDPQGAVARAELTLARPSTEPLRMTGLDPDPLSAFSAAVVACVGDERGVTVAVDVLALTQRERRRLVRRMLRGRRRREARSGGFSELFAGRPSGRATVAERVANNSERRALTDKLGTDEPLLSIQVLIRTNAPTRAEAKARIHGLVAAFDGFAGDNHFRVVGLRLPGVAFLGSDMPWRRGRVDRRLASGRFAPARRRLVTATEIAGLLKPPTARCLAHNVRRSGGVTHAPPPGLPTFTTRRTDLLPLGEIDTETGRRLVGVPLADTFFSYTAGRSRYGKTETAIGQFLHLARSGHGCFFLDPHEDALTKIKQYLTDEELRERVIEINLATGRSTNARQIGWNLFATRGRTAERAAGQVDAVVDAFSSTLGWDERNTRALNLTTQTAQALTELAGRLPAELAPTLFQVPTLLGNEKWRQAVLPYLSPPTRQFFTDRFPRLSDQAITPITNLVDRLRVSAQVAALLGAPSSGYDIRAAMDQGKIVLACPGSGATRDRLLANFLVYDLLHAAKTRASMPPEQRREFHVFLDEVQTYDGSTSGNLAALLEQTAKYGIRAHLFNQNPERLTPATLNAVTTNRSHLLSTALNAKAASLLTREWGSTVQPETVTRLARYTFLASVTLGHQASPPFLLHGVPVDQLLPDDSHPDRIPLLDNAIDTNTSRQLVADTVANLDGHDEAIVAHLDPATSASGGSAAGGTRDYDTSDTSQAS